MKTVAYLGNFGFPDKNAAGKRVLGNCKLLQEIGYRVICIGPGTTPTKDYDGITVYSINRGNEIERVLKDKLPLVKKIIINEEVSVVFLYGALFTQKENIQLIKWCHKIKLRVFYDQVDWLDLNWHNPFRGFIRAMNHRLMNERVIPACDGVICISSFLAEYHSKRGSKTLIIPPLSIEKSSGLPQSFEKNDSRPVRFAYAGTTSDVHRPTRKWKDRIDIMLEKLIEVSSDSSQKTFVLDVYGMTKGQYIDMFPIRQKHRGKMIISLLGEHIRFHGFVTNTEAKEGIRNADFTLLIRDKKRATMAGFPTKVSESISCGTPVLCNDTSDINIYIHNGETGFVMDDVVYLIKNALQLNYEDIVKMKLACSNNPFYFTHYKKQLYNFIEM